MSGFGSCTRLTTTRCPLASVSRSKYSTTTDALTPTGSQATTHEIGRASQLNTNILRVKTLGGSQLIRGLSRPHRVAVRKASEKGDFMGGYRTRASTMRTVLLSGAYAAKPLAAASLALVAAAFFFST